MIQLSCVVCQHRDRDAGIRIVQELILLQSLFKFQKTAIDQRALIVKEEWTSIAIAIEQLSH